MKLWSNYIKEMKIAARGFYFYMEIIVALVVLVLLIFVISPKPGVSVKEIIFMDMSQSQFDHIINTKIDKSYFEKTDNIKIKLKPATITYYDDITKEKTTKIYDDKKTVELNAYKYYDSITGENTKLKYFVDNFDDMLRIAYAKRYFGSTMYYDKGVDYYKTLLWGTETQRYKNIIAASHGNVNMTQLIKKVDTQDVRYLKSRDNLDNRQNFMPIVVVLMNGIMGMLIVIAYICIDKTEGLIKALRVSPFKMSSYLFSKIMVVLTTSVLSTLIITVPVMGTQPNYLLLVITTVILTILSCSIGLIIASFFKDLKSSFGVIMLVCVLFFVPIITYIVPSFCPKWIVIFPTYYMMESIKETLLLNMDLSYVLLTNIGMVLATLILFNLANIRYKKALGM